MKNNLYTAQLQLELQYHLTESQLQQVEFSIQEYGPTVDSRQRKNQLNEKLERLKQARIRVQLGTYGQCEACGELIAPERLEILPDALMCIRCQEATIKQHLHAFLPGSAAVRKHGAITHPANR